MGQTGALTVLEPTFLTKDAAGPILVTVLGMVAEMERKFIRERQQAGIEAAKAKGVYKGRKASVPVQRVREMRSAGHGPTATRPLGRTDCAKWVRCARLRMRRGQSS